jgi:hypothetical protein
MLDEQNFDIDLVSDSRQKICKLLWVAAGAAVWHHAGVATKAKGCEANQ